MRFCFIFILFFVFSSLHAQNNTLLWEVSGKGLQKPSYLFGTIHLRDKRVFCFPDSVTIAFENSDVLALEIVMDFNDPKAVLDKIMIKNDSQSLKNLLTKQEYKKVKKTVAKNLDPTMLLVMDKVLPVLIAAELMSSQTEKDEKYPMDLYLQKQAEKKGKMLYSLESIESQYAVLEKISIEKQKEELLAVVDSMAMYKQLTDSMIALYQHQDIEALYCITNSYNSSFDEAWQEELLDKRNVLMVEKLNEKMKEGSVFVAVGAGHLPGATGLIVLLKAQGYTVRPVYSKCTK
ncbi:MAG: TraB/GumN family protein [Bacteroidetes bacterium]|nr:TraB/GumN family protein [Bacteroidota bacterium]